VLVAGLMAVPRLLLFPLLWPAIGGVGGDCLIAVAARAEPATMRLLIYGLNHAPEPTVSASTPERWRLAALRGHDLRVIAAPPYYRLARGRGPQRLALARRERRDGALVFRVALRAARPRGPPGAASRLIRRQQPAVALVEAIAWARAGLAVAPALAAPGGAAGGPARRRQGLAAYPGFRVDAASRSASWPAAGCAVPCLAVKRAAAPLRPRFDDREVMVAGSPPRASPVAQHPVPQLGRLRAIQPLEGANQLRAELGSAMRPWRSTPARWARSRRVETLIELAPRLPRPASRWCWPAPAAARPRLEAAPPAARRASVAGAAAERSTSCSNLADIHLLPQRADAGRPGDAFEAHRHAWRAAGSGGRRRVRDRALSGGRGLRHRCPAGDAAAMIGRSRPDRRPGASRALGAAARAPRRGGVGSRGDPRRIEEQMQGLR